MKIEITKQRKTCIKYEIRFNNNHKRGTFLVEVFKIKGEISYYKSQIQIVKHRTYTPRSNKSSKEGKALFETLEKIYPRGV